MTPLQISNLLVDRFAYCAQVLWDLLNAVGAVTTFKHRHDDEGHIQMQREVSVSQVAVLYDVL